jgi:hypothetical protein
MHDYVDGLLDEAPNDMDGLAVTPAENDLFTMRGDAELLNDKRAKTFHHLTAKTLYLSKRARPDLLPTVSFLTTRVTKPNVYDWKKLSRCIKYWYYGPGTFWKHRDMTCKTMSFTTTIKALSYWERMVEDLVGNRLVILRFAISLLPTRSRMEKCVLNIVQPKI